jgi:predicted PolB exonuclease-like 3'-5' exonuclease
VRRYLTLDLETVPDEALVGAVDGEPNKPFAEQLRRLIAERRERSGSRSDFLPLPYHRPIAACMLEAEEGEGGLSLTDVTSWSEARTPANERPNRASEAAFLGRFWERLHGRVLITFHGRGFDLPVLELRSLKLGIPAPALFTSGMRRKGSPEHRDMFDLLTNDGAAAPAPLDLYAKLLGLPGKEDTAGKDVQGLYAAGDLDRIAAYCMTDVVQTYLLFLRFRLLEGSLTAEGYGRSTRSVRKDLPTLFARRLGEGEQALLDGFLERCAPYFEVKDLPNRARTAKAVRPALSFVK